VNPERRALLGCLAITDSGGRIIFCSEPFAARIGAAAHELVGRRATELFCDEAWTGQPFVFRETQCELQQFDVATANGEVYLRVVVMRDHGTAPSEADLDLASAPGLAEIPRLTHDLNNIFTVIYASMDMLGRGDIPAKELHEAIESAHRASRRGAEIVTRIRQAIGRDPVSVPATAASRTAPMKGETRDRVLVLSSESTVRLLLRAVLAYRGFEVIDAADLNAARARLNEKGIDFLIVDVGAVDGDWKSCAVRVPTLLLCPVEPPDREGVSWMQKPFDNLELVARVRSMLDARKSV